MANPDKSPKVYNEKNPAQPQGSINPDKTNEKSIVSGDNTPNEKLSIPERKLKKDKK